MRQNVPVRHAPDLARSPIVTADLSAVVQEAQCGSEEAFRSLYRAVQPGLLRYLQVLVGDDAEDIASETWLQIARDLSFFRGDGQGFRGWATTIGRHRALDHLRAQRRRPFDAVPIEQLIDLAGVDDTAAQAEEGVGTAEALALIARLPRDQAEAVLLRVVMGLDAAAAGRVLNKRPGAVRTATYRGLRRLAEVLTQQNPLTARLTPLPQGSSRAASERPPGQPGVTQRHQPTLKDVT
jgi:RNA polymerase sigma-70 factor, ECF subfamily